MASFRSSRTDFRNAPLGRAATGIAVCATALVIVMGAYVMFVNTRPTGLDRWWANLATTDQGTLAAAVGVLLSEVGSLVGVLCCGAIVSAYLLVRREQRAVGMLATALLLGVASSELLKSLVLRPRPPSPLVTVVHSSYPSGHSMGAAALAVSVALIALNVQPLSDRAVRWVWIAAVSWVLLMMWSRTAVSAHWLTDTLGGALLGTAAAFASYRWWLQAGPIGRGRRTSTRALAK